jgi:DNA-binding FadR family transcriptional regulator
MTVEQTLRTLVNQGVREGSLAAGAKLPTERELVDRLSAPRSAIRQALNCLERDGLVIRQVGRGTFLTDTAAQQAAGAPRNTSPSEIMHVRLLLEPGVAATVARVATSADLERITECLDRGGASRDFETFERWDASLHRAIAEAAHNGLLMSMFEVMNTARQLPVWGTFKRRTSTPERRRRYHQEHAAIVEALRDRDPDAARDRMRDHLAAVSDTLLGRQ